MSTELPVKNRLFEGDVEAATTVPKALLKSSGSSASIEIMPMEDAKLLINDSNIWSLLSSNFIGGS